MAEQCGIKLLAVTGATATGKTALAVRLAERYGGEVISGDSMQIYRGMDIGTAKPTVAEMRGIPHHLIDIADISERFCAADFVSLAQNAIAEVASRNKLPIICGGTGMYIRLLLSGRLFETPGGDSALREKLFARAEAEGAEALHAYLAELDPRSAEETHPNNIRRVVRAIEIALTSGRTKAELTDEAQTTVSPYNCLHLHLTSPDRALLYSRADERVDIMLAAGLEREVKGLWENGLEDAPTASAAIGYKEFFPYFRGEAQLSEVASMIKQHTRNYVKRQIAYFARIEDKIGIEPGAGAFSAACAAFEEGIG